MKILLDTHTLLWWLGNDPRLGPNARQSLRTVSNEIWVSHVSLWEIAIKISIGKLRADPVLATAAVKDRGWNLLEMRVEHLSAMIQLDHHHRDPFDRMLVAQAICEGAILMTEDNKLSVYPVSRLSCR